MMRNGVAGAMPFPRFAGPLNKAAGNIPMTADRLTKQCGEI